MPRYAPLSWRRVVPALAVLAFIAPAARASGVRPGPEAPPPELRATDVDVSSYLGWWKSQGMLRSRANATAGTVNQSQYDVHWYDLDLAPNVTTKILTGTVRMTATVVQGPLASVDLDMDTGNLTCDAATSNGLPVTFTPSTGLLTVNLDRPYLTGESIDVTVTYHGRPAAGAFGAAFTDTVYNGRYFVGTLSEPYDARTWWPCKDDPADKADSADVRLTVPSGMITAGNGTRTQYVDNGITSVTRWHERHPISTYLISIASYPYVVTSDWYKRSPTDSMEIRFHNIPEQASLYAPPQAKVKTMMAAFASRYGEYPFVDEKYGHAQFLWGGGMENQTCTSLGTFNEGVIAHELAHQWFGDHVTCRNFHHIWLNEGFATYNEAVWAEATGGIAAFHANMNAKVYTGAGTVYCPDTTVASRIFDSGLTYRKGGWVVAMLRHVMGDALFHAGMQAYVQQYGGSVATTEDFQHVMEAACGRDLTKFFQQWVYGEGVPVYRLAWGSVAAAGGGWDVTVQIQQMQAGQLFWMPVDVRINTGQGNFTFVANDSTALDVFTYHVTAQPTSVQLDPDRWILRSSTIATVAGIGDAGRAATLSLAAPRPNPARGRTAIRFVLPAAGAADVAVVDATGRRVATLAHGALAAGEHHVEWRARDGAGRAVAPGLYWVRLDYGGRSVTQRVALLD